MVAIAGIMVLLIMLLSGFGIVLAAILGIAIYHNHEKRKKEHGKLWVRISLWFVLALGIVIIAFPTLFFGMMMLEDREREAKEVEKKQKVAEEASQWVEGFEIPLSPEEEQEVQEELYDILAIVGDDILSYHEKDSYNTEIPEDKLEEKVNILAENGYTVKTEYVYSNIENWQPLDAFLKHAKQGENDKVSIIRLRTSGLIVREEYVFDGNDMYVISAGVCINTEGAYIQSYRNKSRLKSWSYTEEGWFCYELCVPEYPLVTETVNDSVLLRVKPISEDNRIASEKYVYGLGYKGNNILCTSWDTETVENLDFTGIYEYLYAMEYGKRFELSDAAKGIQKDAFESLLMKYLPVSSQQIRESTEFDEENNVYPWMHLGCGNYAPNSFGTSYPEVIDIQKHADGTMTLTIHAVCESLLNEAVIVHKLTIEENTDGSFQYLKNEILYHGENEIPAYQYRVK